MKPEVSIITPNYNTERFVGATIESVLAQTYGNWEMIIVDDASTDASVDIIREYTNRDERIRLIVLDKNQGQGHARNVATDEAKGRWLAFLDSDDLWHPQKLERHLGFARKSKAVFTHTSYGFIDEEGQKVLEDFHVSKYPVGYRDLLKRTEISCLTAMYKASEIGKFYMPDLRRKQDYKLWLDILKKGYVSHPLDEILAWYRQRSGSTTSAKTDLVFEHYKFLRQQEKLSPIQALYYTAHWGWNGLKKYYFGRKK